MRIMDGITSTVLWASIFYCPSLSDMYVVRNSQILGKVGKQVQKTENIFT